MFVFFFFFFKQKTAYEMVMSDWSSDVCSSDLSRRASRPTRRRAWRKPCWRTCLRGGAGTETNRTRGYPDRAFRSDQRASETPEALMNLEGGCSCAAVRYKLTASPLVVHACHCRD